MDARDKDFHIRFNALYTRYIELDERVSNIERKMNVIHDASLKIGPLEINTDGFMTCPEFCMKFGFISEFVLMQLIKNNKHKIEGRVLFKDRGTMFDPVCVFELFEQGIGISVKMKRKYQWNCENIEACGRMRQKARENLRNLKSD